MPTSIAASYAVNYKLRCQHCHREQQMAAIQDLNLGEVITPAPGGRGYGVCLFCKKPGLKVIDRIESDRA